MFLFMIVPIWKLQRISTSITELASIFMPSAIIWQFAWLSTSSIVVRRYWQFLTWQLHGKMLILNVWIWPSFRNRSFLLIRRNFHAVPRPAPWRRDFSLSPSWPSWLWVEWKVRPFVQKNSPHTHSLHCDLVTWHLRSIGLLSIKVMTSSCLPVKVSTWLRLSLLERWRAHSVCEEGENWGYK